MLKEIISGKRILLKRPDCNMDMARIIYSSINKCRGTFEPWLGWVKYTQSPDDSLRFLESVNDDWENDKHFVYAIYIKNTFIGLISVINVAIEHKRTEIAYWLDTCYTGYGYMREAVRTIEDELFACGFNRLVIHTDVLNVKSAKVPQSLGYVHEGILRQEVWSEPNNRYRDINVFSKLKSD